MDLFSQHAQAVCEGGNTIPPKFEVIAKSAPDNMRVRIIQAWDDAPPFEVNDTRGRSAFIAFGVVHANYATILDRKVVRAGIFGIELATIIISPGPRTRT